LKKKGLLPAEHDKRGNPPRSKNYAHKPEEGGELSDVCAKRDDLSKKKTDRRRSAICRRGAKEKKSPWEKGGVKGEGGETREGTRKVKKKYKSGAQGIDKPVLLVENQPRNN